MCEKVQSRYTYGGELVMDTVKIKCAMCIFLNV